MVGEGTKQRLRAFLRRLEGGDGRVPLTELVDLADNADVDLEIDRSGDPPVVIAAPQLDGRFDLLSPRELEVADLMASGLSNRAIAQTLFISEATVKDHVHAVLRKSGCSSRAEVAGLWRRAPES